MNVELYSDGSSRGNPGPGGYGTLLRYTAPSGNVHEREFSQGYAETTNNRMELMGAIVGFEALNRPCQVDFYSDSQYVIKAFTDNWIDGWIRRGWKRASRGVMSPFWTICSTRVWSVVTCMIAPLRTR